MSYNQCSQQFLDSRTRYGAAYFQDGFRVTPNLTLNLGVRWEVSMPWYDTQGKIETIVPGLAVDPIPDRAPGLGGARRSRDSFDPRTHRLQQFRSACRLGLFAEFP